MSEIANHKTKYAAQRSKSTFEGINLKDPQPSHGGGLGPWSVGYTYIPVQIGTRKCSRETEC
eukprot:12401397-Karenia_brevis.AAC.1